jgi:ABC-2 type transport system permease protein
MVLLQLLFFLAGILIALVTMFSFLLLIESCGFFFSDPGTVARGLLEFFITPAFFHGGAFQGALRVVFTLVVPSLMVGTLPVEMVKSISWPQMGFLSLLAAFWLLLSIWAFYKGVKHYESANLTTFGS